MRNIPLFYLALLITSTIAFVVTVILNAILNSDAASDFGVKDSVGRVGNDNPVDILPAGWTFSVWILIYPWQGLWILYAWTFVFRPLAVNPVSKLLLTLFIISCCLNITWLYFFANEIFTGSFVMILLLELILDAMLGVASYTAYNQVQEMIMNGQKRDVVLTQVLLINGIGIYETWITIAAQVNFAVALQYDYDVSSSTAAIVGLSIVLVEMGTWFVAEVTILDRYVRYSLTVYPVAIWALGGIIANNYKEGEASSILSVVAICIAGTLLVARLVLVVIYHFKKPLHTSAHSTAITQVSVKSLDKSQ